MVNHRMKGKITRKIFTSKAVQSPFTERASLYSTVQTKDRNLSKRIESIDFPIP